MPIPAMDEVLGEINGSTVFSKFDMNMGLHQIVLRRGRGISQHFQLVHDSLYRYKRLSFVENSDPEQYQNIIRQKTADCLGLTNMADDIVVYRRTTEEYVKIL